MTSPADEPDLNPREPEIELLGKLARGGLFAARLVLLCAGAAALVYGLKKTWIEGDGWSWQDVALRSVPSASGSVWIAVGLPLALPADALLVRGLRQVALLLVSVGLWFGPMLLEDDSEYGYILRLFATLIAFLCLVVWRTLWRLTDTGLPRSDDPQTM